MANSSDIISGWRTCELDRYRIHLLLLEKQEKEKDVCIWNQQKEYQILYGKLIYTNETAQSHRILKSTIFLMVNMRREGTNLFSMEMVTKLMVENNDSLKSNTKKEF